MTPADIERAAQAAGNAILTLPGYKCPCQHRRTPMAFDLTASLDARRKTRLARAILDAAELIRNCPDPQKQWRATHELRKLQARLRNPVL